MVIKRRCGKACSPAFNEQEKWQSRPGTHRASECHSLADPAEQDIPLRRLLIEEPVLSQAPQRGTKSGPRANPTIPAVSNSRFRSEFASLIQYCATTYNSTVSAGG